MRREVGEVAGEEALLEEDEVAVSVAVVEEVRTQYTALGLLRCLEQHD